MKPMSASDMLRNVVRLERRTPTTAVRILESDGSPWRRFREDPKVLHREMAHVIEAAFDEGGYVAGGCARWLRHQSSITPFLRGSYVKAGGDIDLFFRDELGWKRFVEGVLDVTEQEKSRLKVVMSKGSLAANITMQVGHSFNSAPPVQAICCTVAEPEEMLRGFDFVNAMVAFDRDKSWVAEGWDEHEKSKTLAVAWWGSRSITYRIAKYVQKYAYSTLRDVSDGRMVEQLIAGYDAMSVSCKATSASVWNDLMTRSGFYLDLEQKLTILGAATDGLNVKNIIEASKETRPGDSGFYERVMSDLLARQERALAKSRKANQLIPLDRDLWSIEHETTDADDDPFDVDEYCWSV